MTDVPDNAFTGLDMKELMEIVDNDLELMKECFADFIDTWQQFFNDMESAATALDSQGLGQRAHAFKGSLQYLAATHAMDIILRLEAAGKSGDFSSVDADLGALKKECQALERYMALQLTK